ncbi:hypothetical protein GCM10022378_16610 [Salinicoccus jeotgali]|uniref:Uncharacterized protein n=1 Tax=Salinicoccus jeotgali TaxID=381634 RepID=A0ABP7EZT1_9STAP
MLSVSPGFTVYDPLDEVVVLVDELDEEFELELEELLELLSTVSFWLM